MTEITNITAYSDLPAHNVRRPAMLQDWTDVAMAHFIIDPRKLQPFVPLPLDTFRFRGREWAYVTLVPFRVINLRCPLVWTLPGGDHRLLNVRTYVKPEGACGGIYFLREFTDHRLHSILAPLLYGTPYHYARFNAPGSIACGNSALHLTVTPFLNTTSAAPGGLDHFLLERYSAWCSARPGGRLMRFDVAHSPWRFRHAAARYHDTALLARTFPWFAHAQPLTHGGAHVCLPLRNVRIGFPTKARGRPSPGATPTSLTELQPWTTTPSSPTRFMSPSVSQ